ncbi:MAG: ATP-binding protein, partial [Rhodothermales bacterium]
DATSRFLPDPLLGKVVSVGGSPEEFKVTEANAGNIWTNFGGESAVLRPNGDGTYRTEKTPLLRFANSPATEIYPEESGVVWFGGNEVLIRYDPRVFKDYSKTYPTLVRRVTLNEDSTLYGGAPGVSTSGFELASGQNALRFEYATPSYEDPRSNRYQTMLDGFDEHWSTWTSEVRRDYTNLPAGEYTFRVHAKNVYDQESTEGAFSFHVVPAWYVSWWAWLLYVVAGGGAVVGLVRVRTEQLKRRSMELEHVVNSRTTELKDKNLELEKQRDELEQAYENVELLSKVGQDITARLSIKEIIDTVYENVNALMDAAVFGIGIYNPKTDHIEMPATKENGVTLPAFFFPTDDESRPAVWSFKNSGEVFFNDYEKEYADFFGKELVAAVEGENPQSMIYLPLINKGKAVGVITAQSFRKQAYTEYHLNILRNLATYTAIAIDNAEAYQRLNATLGELNATVQNLKTTQQQLVTQEKLASLGSLTAGIAHEIKNPLNFVNNFAELVSEMAKELGEEIAANKDRKIQEVFEELDEILTGLKINAAQIKKHGKRADGIVKNMMEHAQEGEGQRYAVAFNDLVEEYVGLAHHAVTAKSPELDVEIVRSYDAGVGSVELMPQEIGRVFLNLLSNAFDAVDERRGMAGADYQPTVTVSTKRHGNRVEVTFSDNGPGIPDAVRSKIFEPFFTTKPTGGGTGLGLSLSYDIIVQGHGGSLDVDSVQGQGASFSIGLPVKAQRGGVGEPVTGLSPL